MSTYTIQPGDTLSAITTSHSLALNDLLAANPSIDPQDLQIGQVINLPGSAGSAIPGSQGDSQCGGDDTEIGYIKTAIETVAAESGVDVRAILCIIVQESGGDVRAGSTNNGVHNPGLMRSHNGTSFDANDAQGSILQMVKDGTEGTKDGDGLKQLSARYGNYYETFRGYNSGSVNTADMNDPMGATGSYVRDLANRLMDHE
ncbi:hypothetical protein MMC17_010226 [Xylographa soralifera]|nr:hypothetical protein [Xylographa soralifera]